MHELLATVAHGLDGILPDGFQLPSLTYVLPHSVYWIGLILFPLAAMYMVRRAERQRPSDYAAARIKPAIAWLLWIGGGFVGLHRFYLRTSLLGFVYIALTLVVLVSSNNAYDSRVAVSGAATEIEIAEMDSDYYAGQAEQGVEGAEARLARSEEHTSELQSLMRISYAVFCLNK